jgi:hypothetical protein
VPLIAIGVTVTSWMARAGTADIQTITKGPANLVIV